MIRLSLLCDIGSVITKATLLEAQTQEGANTHKVPVWTIKGVGKAPTTLEPPHSDVMLGLRDAIKDLEDKVGMRFLNGSRLLTPNTKDGGVDFFAATTSAGGGLRVLVAGLTSKITAQSGHKAALGAGAVVSSVLSLQDMRGDFATIEKLRREKVDMILVTGGTDGGNTRDILSLLEFLAMVNPTPRAGNGARMPLVYAGNQEAREKVAEMIGDQMEVVFSDNVRPNVDTESFYSVREAIQRVFFDHMVRHTPGYKSLATWANCTVKPTPTAMAQGLTYMSLAFSDSPVNALAVDLGGSTVDVFSVIGQEMNRTVMFNTGISPYPYEPIDNPKSTFASIGPTVKEVSRWLPWGFKEDLVRNWSFNRILRPVSVPQTSEELFVEHGYAREIIRKALEEHRKLITKPKGLSNSEKTRRPGLLKDDESLVDLMNIRLVVATGGPLSYAPKVSQALSIMLDAIQPEGVTDLFLDRGAFLPALGILVDVLDKESQRSLFANLVAEGGILPLGTVIAPVGPKVSPGTEIAKVVIEEPFDSRKSGEPKEKASEKTSYPVLAGDIVYVPLNRWPKAQPGVPSAVEPPIQIEVTPARGFTVGNGNGFSVTAKVKGGYMGLIFDGRGRPLTLSNHEKVRIATLKRWWKALEAYGETAYEDSVYMRDDSSVPRADEDRVGAHRGWLP